MRHATTPAEYVELSDVCGAVQLVGEEPVCCCGVPCAEHGPMADHQAKEM